MINLQVDHIAEFMGKGYFRSLRSRPLCSPLHRSFRIEKVENYGPKYPKYPLAMDGLPTKFNSSLHAPQLRLSTPTYSQHFMTSQLRHFSDVPSEYTVKVPKMGDSITEGSVNHWKKAVGNFIEADEIVAVIDTDKVSVDINSPVAGQLAELFAAEGDVVEVGKPLFILNTAAVMSNIVETQNAASKHVSDPAKKDPITAASAKGIPSSPPAVKKEKDHFIPPKVASAVAPTEFKDARGEKRTPMSRMRLRIAERLKGAQNTAAMLTTFNECDMGSLMALRSEMNEAFQEVHEIKMGFVSAFLSASALSLKKFPAVNAYIEDKEIVYKDYVDISVAVATPNGLMVPVIRDCDKKNWADLEKDLNDLAKRARKNQIALEEMAGGTFTISNGGVYGSMMGTPLLNPPQSSILGMHTITKRAVVRGDQIVIRPMMYLALTYDHRLIDGRDAVIFLNSIKSYVEDPRKMLLNL
ncbi:dihydrolipoyllysine-residue succinyltransferase component of oxoglutarate dehydrogenase [Cardiosporidium cionae]|uniref:dihydrolipoyllysine-residue succinyltransferase n=1 Tax=Cardiosporidium cionae TaxID=476202 RepID=A0ABQ7J490_9APIC|nr:dihydrolipoyllysine-residue succinyltransferase component of oxoglutarate dehydrogenase [Cardiosporidium cionae]|eukprot:KAF8817895.1 dihydrolipoyllysine-residue succinyltransferase component of oxoglutarate dehydrogenase [Cardiosporidium cionae]